jgi:hypothetical protein
MRREPSRTSEALFDFGWRGDAVLVRHDAGARRIESGGARPVEALSLADRERHQRNR